VVSPWRGRANEKNWVDHNNQSPLDMRSNPQIMYSKRHGKKEDPGDQSFCQLSSWMLPSKGVPDWDSGIGG